MMLLVVVDGLLGLVVAIFLVRLSFERVGNLFSVVVAESRLITVLGVEVFEVCDVCVRVVASARQVSVLW